jgi:hypothetical protein
MQKSKQKIEPNEQVFATEYSPPFIQPASQVQPKVELKVEPEKIQISPNDISNCKIKLNDRIKEINNLKTQHLAEKQKIQDQREIDDQNLNLQNAIKMQKYKLKTTEVINQYKQNDQKINDIKIENTNCQARISGFPLTLEQAQICCLSESQKALKIKQDINEKCTVAHANLISKLSSLNNEIPNIQNQIDELKSSNDDLINKLKDC